MSSLVISCAGKGLLKGNLATYRIYDFLKTPVAFVFRPLLRPLLALGCVQALLSLHLSLYHYHQFQCL